MKTSYYWSYGKDINSETFTSITTFLAENNYSSGDTSGFIIDKRTRSEAHGTYVEKHVYSESSQDPFGTEVSTERISYEYLPFRIKTSPPHFEFAGHPRLQTQFFNKISIEFPTYISETRVRFKLIRIYETLSQNFSVEVLALRIDGFLINGRTICGIEFRSTIDVRNDMTSFVKKNSFEVTYSKIRLISPSGQQSEIEIWQTGRLATSLSPDSPEFEKIRTAIALECKTRP